MTPAVSCVVFDVGRVLIEWDVNALLAPMLGSEQAVDAFLVETGFMEWNLSLDRGATLAESLPEMRQRYPHYADIFDVFAMRWIETTPGAIEGSVAVLDDLRARKVPLYAITNFSAETWPKACAKYPFLASHFVDVVVSGEVGLLKPDLGIFEKLIDRNSLHPADCLFIDDSAKNVVGARAAGMQAMQFTGPYALRKALTYRGLL